MAHPGHHDLVCECGIRLGGCRCFAPGKERRTVSPCQHLLHGCADHPDVRVQARPDDHARCPFCQGFLVPLDREPKAG